MEYPTQSIDTTMQQRSYDHNLKVAALEIESQLIHFNKYVNNWVYLNVDSKIKKAVITSQVNELYPPIVAPDTASVIAPKLRSVHNELAGRAGSNADANSINHWLKEYPEVFSFLRTVDKLIDIQKANYINIPPDERGLTAEVNYETVLAQLKVEYGEIDE